MNGVSGGSCMDRVLILEKLGSALALLPLWSGGVSCMLHTSGRFSHDDVRATSPGSSFLDFFARNTSEQSPLSKLEFLISIFHGVSRLIKAITGDSVRILFDLITKHGEVILNRFLRYTIGPTSEPVLDVPKPEACI
eukprot:ANDGO_06562.mRNA.1 hypothetical protein